MTRFLDISLELRNHVYDLLITTFFELKQAIRHLAVAKQLAYELHITFSHGRPYFSLTWVRLPALLQTINFMIINVDLRVCEPWNGLYDGDTVPHDYKQDHLLEDSPDSFARQLFDYIALLLKAPASLLSNGDSTFRVLFVETMILNFRTPTTLASSLAISNTQRRRVRIKPEETLKLHDTMRHTLKANAKAFLSFDAAECGNLSPLIQIGSLCFATEAHDDFQWLCY
ncbi:hypothetical protein K458DRAFT_439181 [Lentithecium fluviatile CBS 122367]|uniref:Uncharacterized protein n=1 Tax=Lentithecium fluviatile CBS 122367 TaxID=1168545 RepID=A0A6G1JI16_9PLEO|nr:hypothetical protein K458DRAFT_439181 [Lentithecium fluviatile CBS 122367]